MGVGTATAMLASSAISAGTQLAQDSPDPPSPPSRPAETRTEVEPGVDRVRRRITQPDGSVVVKEDIIRSDEKQEELQEREQMIDELFQSIGTTDSEREEQFEEAKQSYIEQFETSVEPVFEEQRGRLQAEQVASGRSASSIGAQEREDLQQEQNQTIAQNRRQAEQLASDLQRREEQRKLNLIGQLQSGVDTDLARAQQAANTTSALANQSFAQDQARFRAQRAGNQIERAEQNRLAQTAGALSGFALRSGPDFSQSNLDQPPPLRPVNISGNQPNFFGTLPEGGANLA